MRISLWLSAAREMCGQYRRVLRDAWHTRDKNPVLWNPDEAEFLPAALALERTPVSPLPRVAMGMLLALLVLAVLWAIFGKIDIVATADGKIVPDGRAKIIQSIETAKVTAIHVRDGQLVQAGDVLLELDSTASAADRLRLRDDWAESWLAAMRARAVLAGIASGSTPQLEAPRAEDDVPAALVPSAARIAQEQRFLEGELGEFRSKVARLDAEIARNRAELQTVGAVINRLQQTLKIARSREGDLNDLAAKNYVSRHEYLEKQQTRIEQEGELAAQKSRTGEIQAAMMSARRQHDELVATTRRTMLDNLNSAAQKAAELRQEFIKADAHDRFMTLKAPVDGAIQQLAVHTVGGVVTAAQPLMVVVPRDRPAEIEAFLENRDVGFVRAGQNAAAKIETFLYTRYGTLPAEVLSVSHDAIEDEKRGLIYAVRLKLPQATMHIDGEEVELTPGMAASVEIKTGKRRLIEYFMSPLLTHVNESLHER
ncbi:HlyD family type I secretion periplasmic adaptor subunit [Paraburkholderia bonniea]|uniref:HlyD family type I secretion periplasmic adaptor subunit n=1 Tax=Paraburkholderia bonniea TaxID=2152891 RepID=UPI0012921D99|nr:HlyD family type I secretion periplasmic adaptor subunit [Paraburkholderia bonniea]WJF90384.1 HlyD family type I secretion periplasmic adaptor subunit [Paraburkholderia bonniea]WJF93699.1 HlyD family type I secretion periplasmic adaptor subunit [Paraburkholderia bonniea]